MKFALKPLKFILLSDNKLYAPALGYGVYIEPKMEVEGMFFNYYAGNGNGNGKRHRAETLEEAKAECAKLAIQAVHESGMFEEVD